MPVVTRAIIIAAPPAEVWPYASETRHQVRWMRDMKEVRLDTPELGLGTHALARVRMFGVTVDDPVTVTAWDPPRRFAIAHHGVWAGDGEVRLAAANGGRSTRVVWRERLRFEPAHVRGSTAIRRAAQLVRMTDALAWPVFAYVFRSDLRRLRRLIEDARSRS